MNIFLRELKANLKSLLIWTGIMILFVVASITKYSAFASDPEVISMLDSISPAIMDAFNMRAFNLTTLSGFFGIIFPYFSLMGAIAAAMWGSTIISKEERDRTVEFSLVLPVSRSQLITTKALAALVYCVSFVGITWLVSLIAVRPYAPDSSFSSFLRLGMLAMLLVTSIFLAIGLLLGTAMKRYKRSGAAAVAIILVTYFLSVVTDIQKDFGFLKYLTPFKYFDAAVFLRSGSFEPIFLGMTAAIILASMVLAYRLYNKRDLYI